MHKALNITRDYQQYITDQSKGPRHGDPQFVEGTITREVSMRTWSIMNRFLEYRKRGNQPLMGPDFPLLEEPQPN
jgi:hypothetical protein